jgi:Fe-S-cluster containining protein
VNGSGANVAGCATCKGRCCREYRVEITATDVRKLSAGTGLHPSEFITLVNTAPGKNGFRLSPDGPPNELNLIRDDATRGCVFLMEIGPDLARCGVYAHRPLVCSNFPTALMGGSVAIRQEVKCGPNSWNLATMDLATYRRDLMRSEAAYIEHQRLIALWNTIVDSDGRERASAELFEFLINGPSIPAGLAADSAEATPTSQ